MAVYWPDHVILLQRVEPLLCNDSEVGRYTGAFLDNGSVNTFPQRYERNTKRVVFSVWSVPRCYKQGTNLELVSSVRECVKRGLESEAK
jgi:hypothetical protein